MNINDLEYYPRFVFKCPDGKVISTADLDVFKNISHEYWHSGIYFFKTGDVINILRDDRKHPYSYKIYKIDIVDIKSDSDTTIKGMDATGSSEFVGKNKIIIMTINIELEDAS